MQQHDTEQAYQITDAALERLYQVLKQDPDLGNALRVMSEKLHIPKREIVLRVCV